MRPNACTLLVALTGVLCGRDAAQSDSARTPTGVWFAQQGQGPALVRPSPPAIERLEQLTAPVDCPEQVIRAVSGFLRPE